MEQEELAAESMRVLALLERRDQEEEADRRSMAQLLAHTIPPPPAVPQFTELMPLELDLDEPFALVSRRALPPPPPPTVKSKDVRYKLADAWVLLTECQEAINGWKNRAQVDVGLRALEATVRQACGLVDDAISELEPPTDRKSKRPTHRP